jgi:hypothetical protein
MKGADFQKALDIAIQKHVAPHLIQDNAKFVERMGQALERVHRVELELADIRARLDSPCCPTCGRRRNGLPDQG